jgi:hypothetical protein
MFFYGSTSMCFYGSDLGEAVDGGGAAAERVYGSRVDLLRKLGQDEW